MKGIVFTEFLEFAAQSWGEDMVDDVIEDCNFDHGGAYTAVGSYSHEELALIGSALSRRSEVEVPEILRGFGRHLGHRFATLFPAFFERESFFSFLDSIQNHIHVEVRKLYPDAELPTFHTLSMDEERMVLEYRSSRHLQSLAEGLILGTADVFGRQVEVETKSHNGATGEVVTFQVGLMQ